MLEYYPTLIEAAVAYRPYSRKILAEYKSIKINALIKYRVAVYIRA